MNKGSIVFAGGLARRRLGRASESERGVRRVYNAGPKRGTDAYAARGKERKEESEEYGGGCRGRQPGRTGAYGADPSGASANVSVSVSAGRARALASGPADIIQEVTSRTCPVIPLLPLPFLLLALSLRAFARRAALSDIRRRRCFDLPTVFASRQSGDFRSAATSRPA